MNNNKKFFCRALILAASMVSSTLQSMNQENSRPTTSASTGLYSTEKRSRVIPVEVWLQEINGVQTLIVPIPVLRNTPKVLEEFKKYPITSVKVVRGTGKQRTLCLSGTDLTTLATYFPDITGLDLSDTRLRHFPSGLSFFFPKLTSLSLQRNNKLEPTLGPIIYSDLAKRLVYLNIADTTINLSEGWLKNLFPNARIIVGTHPNEREIDRTNTTTSAESEKQPESTTSTTSTSRDTTLPPLLPLVASLLTATQADSNNTTTEEPPCSETSSEALEDDQESGHSSTAPKKKRRLALRVVPHSKYPLKNVLATTSSASKKDELITAIRNYLNEYQEITRPDTQSGANFGVTQRLIALRTIKLPGLEQLLTDYRNSGHILNSLLSPTTGLAHTLIEYENPELLELVSNLEPDVLISNNDENGYKPLELLLKKYAHIKDENRLKTGLQLLNILLKALQKNKTIMLQDAVTRRAVRQALEHGPVEFMQALVKTLVPMAYNDAQFTGRLLRLAGQGTYDAEHIQQELIAYISQYARISLTLGNRELIKNELQTLARSSLLPPLQDTAQKRIFIAI